MGVWGGGRGAGGNRPVAPYFRQHADSSSTHIKEHVELIVNKRVVTCLIRTTNGRSVVCPRTMGDQLVTYPRLT
jgi:hypothetical protein